MVSTERVVDVAGFRTARWGSTVVSTERSELSDRLDGPNGPPSPSGGKT